MESISLIDLDKELVSGHTTGAETAPYSVEGEVDENLRFHLNRTAPE